MLFSSNKVFTHAELIQFDKRLLDPLVHKLKSKITGDTKKIVLCGHSFGCVLALRTGKLFQNTYEDIFNTNIIIVGSAPFKHSNDLLYSFSYLHNVKIFIHTTTYELTPSVIFIDCFANRGDSKTHYQPVTYINTHIDKENKHSYTFKTDNDTHYVHDYISSNQTCQEYHSWDNYYKVLSKLYPFKLEGGRIKPNKIKCINTKRYRNVRRSTLRKRKIYKRQRLLQ